VHVVRATLASFAGDEAAAFSTAFNTRFGFSVDDFFTIHHAQFVAETDNVTALFNFLESIAGHRTIARLIRAGMIRVIVGV